MNDFGSAGAPASTRLATGRAAGTVGDPVNPTADPATAPVLARRWLAAELGRLRRTARLTQSDAATALGWSVSKAVRVENGQVPVTPTDVAALAALYEVIDPDRVAALRAAAVQGRAAPWHRFRDVLNPGMLGYLAMAEAAATITMFRHSVVPDLLQTLDYSRAVTAAVAPPSWNAARIERRVQAGARIRALLDRPEPPQIVVLLDEALVAGLAHGGRTLRDQLAHLHHASGPDRVTVGYVPLEFGPHRGHAAEFTVLHLPGAQPQIVYQHHSIDQAEPHPGVEEHLRLSTVLESAAQDLSALPATAARNSVEHRAQPSRGNSLLGQGMAGQAALR